MNQKEYSFYKKLKYFFQSTHLTYSEKPPPDPFKMDTVFSPCEILSPFTSKNIVRTKSSDFEQVRTIIHDRLTSLPEITFSYKETDQSFLCEMKHEEDASYRVYRLDCYWDPKQQEHVIDVRRIAGEGFHRFTTHLFDEISAAFDKDYVIPPIAPLPVWLQVRALPEDIDAFEEEFQEYLKQFNQHT